MLENPFVKKPTKKLLRGNFTNFFSIYYSLYVGDIKRQLHSNEMNVFSVAQHKITYRITFQKNWQLIDNNVLSTQIRLSNSNMISSHIFEMKSKDSTKNWF